MFCKLIYTAVDLIQWKKLDFQNLYESNLTEARFEITNSIRIMTVQGWFLGKGSSEFYCASKEWIS